MAVPRTGHPVSLMTVACAVLAIWLMAPATVAGEPAPPFALPALDEEAAIVDLDGYRGSVVYVDFWASWCTSCRASFRWMNELQQRYAGRDFKVIAVNLDERAEDARQFLADNVARFTVAYDPAGLVAESYHVRGVPSAYLIDRDGRIRYVHQGFVQGDRAEVEYQIRQLLVGGD